MTRTDHKAMKRSYQSTISIITNVINEWDPYSLISGGAPKDEFESEIARIAVQVSEVKTVTALAELISSVFSASFEPELFSVEICMPVASRIFGELNTHRPMEGKL